MISRQSKGFCLALIAAIGALGCSDANAPEGEPPTLPPLTSFVIDFTDFADAGLDQASAFQAAPMAGTYWTGSAVVVGFWSALVAVTLAPPTAAFIASFAHEPEWDGAGAWVWEYDFAVLMEAYSARLEGRLITDAIQWEMYISKEGDFTDFNWFSGISHASGTSGTWTLNRSPDNPGAYLDIEWSRAASAETYEISYTNVASEGDGYGNYIEHGVTTSTPYNAFYNLYNAANHNLTQIQWNRTTKAGRTADFARFGDPDWRCWDENLENTTCQ